MLNRNVCLKDLKLYDFRFKLSNSYEARPGNHFCKRVVQQLLGSSIIRMFCGASIFRNFSAALGIPDNNSLSSEIFNLEQLLSSAALLLLD